MQPFAPISLAWDHCFLVQHSSLLPSRITLGSVSLLISLSLVPAPIPSSCPGSYPVSSESQMCLRPTPLLLSPETSCPLLGSTFSVWTQNSKGILDHLCRTWDAARQVHMNWVAWKYEHIPQTLGLSLRSQGVGVSSLGRQQTSHCILIEQREEERFTSSLETLIRTLILLFQEDPQDSNVFALGGIMLETGVSDMKILRELLTTSDFICIVTMPRRWSY